MYIVNRIFFKDIFGSMNFLFLLPWIHRSRDQFIINFIHQKLGPQMFIKLSNPEDVRYPQGSFLFCLLYLAK